MKEIMLNVFGVGNVEIGLQNYTEIYSIAVFSGEPTLRQKRTIIHEVEKVLGYPIQTFGESVGDDAYYIEAYPHIEKHSLKKNQCKRK